MLLTADLLAGELFIADLLVGEPFTADLLAGEPFVVDLLTGELVAPLPHKVVAGEAEGSVKFAQAECSAFSFDPDITDNRISIQGLVQGIDAVLPLDVALHLSSSAAIPGKVDLWDKEALNKTFSSTKAIFRLFLRACNQLKEVQTTFIFSKLPDSRNLSS